MEKSEYKLNKLKESAKKGDSAAQFILFIELFYGADIKQDKEQAFYWLNCSSSNGYPLAQFTLSKCYFNGIYIEKDESKGFNLVKKLVEKGNLDGQAFMGICYYKGLGTECDYQKAFYWLSKTTEVYENMKYEKEIPKIFVEAQYYLANCYYNGFGVEKDIDKAVEIYYNLFNIGYHKAMVALINYLHEKNNEDVIQAALCWSFCSGLILDGFPLTNEYRTSKLVHMDLNSLFSSCNDEDDEQYNKAECILFGFGTKERKMEAISLYTLLAQKGHAKSQYTLGRCFYDGTVVDRDSKVAAYWLLKSAENNYAPAQLMLAILYYEGLGVDKDINLADYYLSHAYQGLIDNSDDYNEEDLNDILSVINIVKEKIESKKNKTK